MVKTVKGGAAGGFAKAGVKQRAQEAALQPAEPQSRILLAWLGVVSQQ